MRFTLHLSTGRNLFFEVVQILNLGPYKICLLYFISKGIPWSPRNQPSYHARIIPFPHKNFETMVVLYWNLYVPIIRKVNFPKKVSIIVSFKRYNELSSHFLRRNTVFEGVHLEGIFLNVKKGFFISIS